MYMGHHIIINYILWVANNPWLRTLVPVKLPKLASSMRFNLNEFVGIFDVNRLC